MKNLKLVLLSGLCLCLLTGCGSDTISNEYSSKDVALRCSNSVKKEKGNISNIVDIVVDGDNVKTYVKITIDYNNLDDETVKELLCSIDAYGCLNDTNYINVNGRTEFPGITNYGKNTVAVRNKNKVTVTYDDEYSNPGIKELKKEFESEGYTCK